MSPWPWIVSGAALCIINPILGVVVMWPGCTILVRRALRDEDGSEEG